MALSRLSAAASPEELAQQSLDACPAVERLLRSRPRGLFTDIDGDGLLKGVNVTATAALARALSIPVIASGGVGSIADIDALRCANEPNIEGVVVGRALYDGRIDPADALARAG